MLRANGGAIDLRSEVSRKGIHLLTGLVPLSYALWGRRDVIAWVLGVMTAGMLLIEVLRRFRNPIGDLFRRWFGFMLREKESVRLIGATHYCAASWLCVLLFDRPVAVLALLYLAVGDTAASLVGMRWGRRRIGAKTWEGWLAFCLATALVAIVARLCSPAYPLGAALVAAPVAGLAELLLQKVDDNWTVPIAAGATMTLVILIFSP